MNILPESRSRATGAHFILINGALTRVDKSEYGRWVAMHNAGNVAGIGDRQAPVALSIGSINNMEARS
jgi:hypothetical protein